MPLLNQNSGDATGQTEVIAVAGGQRGGRAGRLSMVDRVYGRLCRLPLRNADVVVRRLNILRRRR